jgi:hypothetical protein
MLKRKKEGIWHINWQSCSRKERHCHWQQSINSQVRVLLPHGENRLDTGIRKPLPVDYTFSFSQLQYLTDYNLESQNLLQMEYCQHVYKVLY